MPGVLMNRIAVIIVTHNSEQVLDRCLSALRDQTVQPETIVVVDAGSRDTGYLNSCSADGRFQLHLEKNIGFGRANNRAYQKLDPSMDFVLFLNPDAFPAEDALASACAYMESNQEAACLGGRLLGFDPGQRQATGKLDSTGVFRKWYGCWYDRDQGKPDDGRHREEQDVPAVCGAFLFCRKSMLDQVALEQDVVFDPDFFLYKEDIELCLRIRKTHWKIVYLPDILVYHCRGWGERRKMPHARRLLAARSELLLYTKHPSPYIIWALAKYMAVSWLRL